MFGGDIAGSSLIGEGVSVRHVAGLCGGGHAIGGQHDVGAGHFDGPVRALDGVDANGGRSCLCSSTLRVRVFL